MSDYSQEALDLRMKLEDAERQLKIARSALRHIEAKPLWSAQHTAEVALIMMDDPAADVNE